MPEPAKNNQYDENDGATRLTETNKSSWKADVYRNGGDSEPSAKVQVSSIADLFERASAAGESD